VWAPGEDKCEAHADGDGIKDVTITITLIGDEASTEVHQRTEENPAYCPFGDNGRNTICNEWVFAEHNNRWPDGKTVIEPGSYEASAVIRREGKEDTFWFFRFEIVQR
jgi:hypothetical protein